MAVIGGIQIWCLVIITVVCLSDGRRYDQGVCSLPSVTGPCRAYIPSYFFSIKSGQCERFVYGGCRGNANRFETLGECQTACRGISSGVCTLPNEIGSCDGVVPRYYFNDQSGRCERFDYGGCEGNRNNFRTFRDCWTSCGDQGVCSLPSVTGPCRAYIPSYFFNIKTGQCERFVYGGCRGNANRFETLGECQTACRGCGPCKLPKVVGPCEAAIRRYYYNYKVQECQFFYYGGCEGNANNFETIEECRYRCH